MPISLPGDIGLSLRFQRPVSNLGKQFMWPTLFLTSYVLCLAIPPTVVLAILGARRRSGIAGQTVRLLGIAGLTIPVFWLGIMMSRFFGVSLGWFPVSGLRHRFLEPSSSPLSAGPVDGHLAVPVLTPEPACPVSKKRRPTSLPPRGRRGATGGRYSGRPCCRTPRCRRSTCSASWWPFMIGGAVIVETVYAVPGLGTLMVNALLGRDYYVVRGLTLIFAVSTVLITLMVDLLTAFIDRASGSEGIAHG
ncbi:ABC transporter permease subunit [Rhizobium beringeri]